MRGALHGSKQSKGRGMLSESRPNRAGQAQEKHYKNTMRLNRGRHARRHMSRAVSQTTTAPGAIADPTFIGAVPFEKVGHPQMAPVQTRGAHAGLRPLALTYRAPRSLHVCPAFLSACSRGFWGQCATRGDGHSCSPDCRRGRRRRAKRKNAKRSYRTRTPREPWSATFA